jgi:ankyrin repeat protein
VSATSDLCSAAPAGDLIAAQEALRAGADPDARDPLGYPPYIDAGARLDLRALDGRTPLEMARQYGYPEIVELLRRAERERDGAG